MLLAQLSMTTRYDRSHLSSNLIVKSLSIQLSSRIRWISCVYHTVAADALLYQSSWCAWYNVLDSSISTGIVCTCRNTTLQPACSFVLAIPCSSEDNSPFGCIKKHILTTTPFAKKTIESVCHFLLWNCISSYYRWTETSNCACHSVFPHHFPFALATHLQ